MPGAGHPEPEADVRKTGDTSGPNPRTVLRSQTRRLTSFGPGHRTTGTGRKPETSHSSAGVYGARRRARPPDGAELMNRSTNQNPSRGTQLRKRVGALNPEFAFAGAAGTTRGPVAQNATTTIFGRQRIVALSLASETFDGPFISGNTQAIAGYHFTEGDACHRRTPAAAAGSARQRVNENKLRTSYPGTYFSL